MNHLASCAPPFCSCHPPQHICHWEKKHSDRKPHPNELLHDTKDHFFKLKFIWSQNGVHPPRAHVCDCRNPHTGGKSGGYIQTHTFSQRKYTFFLRQEHSLCEASGSSSSLPRCCLWADTCHWLVLMHIKYHFSTNNACPTLAAAIPLLLRSPGFHIVHAELHRKESKLISRPEMESFTADQILQQKLPLALLI